MVPGTGYFLVDLKSICSRKWLAPVVPFFDAFVTRSSVEKGVEGGYGQEVVFVDEQSQAVFEGEFFDFKVDVVAGLSGRVFGGVGFKPRHKWSNRDDWLERRHKVDFRSRMSIIRKSML